mmetsp:Transcript_3694/g.10167  ORF Transcript_3694/g.10167 Transcript_3694/m.10167 type:complete len:86 (-) Transcript_3694:2343-2600(-)
MPVSETVNAKTVREQKVTAPLVRSLMSHLSEMLSQMCIPAPKITKHTLQMPIQTMDIVSFLDIPRIAFAKDINCNPAVKMLAQEK